MGTPLRVAFCVLLMLASSHAPSPPPGVRKVRRSGAACGACGTSTRMNAGQVYCPNCDHCCAAGERPR